MEETTKNEDYLKDGDLNKMGRRQEMRVYRNSVASLCSNCCNGEAITAPRTHTAVQTEAHIATAQQQF
jgi:hypothetical protein